MSEDCLKSSYVFAVSCTVISCVLMGIWGLYFLIFVCIFDPKEVKFHVTEASLTQFNFTNTNMLHYNLALNITLRNSNKRVGLYYERIEAAAFYRKKWLATVSLTPFYQGHKNTSILGPVFEGQQLVMLGTRDLSKLDKEKTAGVYNIDVKLSLRMRARFGKIRSFHFKPPKIKCYLKLPLSSDHQKSADGFHTTECDGVNILEPLPLDTMSCIAIALCGLLIMGLILMCFIAYRGAKNQ